LVGLGKSEGMLKVHGCRYALNAYQAWCCAAVMLMAFVVMTRKRGVWVRHGNAVCTNKQWVGFSVAILAQVLLSQIWLERSGEDSDNRCQIKAVVVWSLIPLLIYQFTVQYLDW
jgi:hypothetical protein